MQLNNPMSDFDHILGKKIVGTVPQRAAQSGSSYFNQCFIGIWYFISYVCLILINQTFHGAKYLGCILGRKIHEFSFRKNIVVNLFSIKN